MLAGIRSPNLHVALLDLSTCTCIFAFSLYELFKLAVFFMSAYLLCLFCFDFFPLRGGLPNYPIVLPSNPYALLVH